MDWRDLFYLLRHREHVLVLDHARLLTHGSPAAFSNLLGSFSLTNGLCTAVSVQDKPRLSLIGQALYNGKERAARLEYLLPAGDSDSPALLALLDELARQTGELGAESILAEIEPDQPAFEALRRCGFSVFAWQCIWQFSAAGNGRKIPDGWEAVKAQDEFAVRGLYAALVPPLVQSAEALRLERSGYVYRQDGNLLAYAPVTVGPLGMYSQPLIHPDVKNPSALMASLLESLPAGRPLYIGLRSYQSWLEPTLQRLGGQASERQALLVKHFTLAQRALLPALRHSVLEQRGEPTAPIVNQAAPCDNMRN